MCEFYLKRPRVSDCIRENKLCFREKGILTQVFFSPPFESACSGISGESNENPSSVRFGLLRLQGKCHIQRLVGFSCLNTRVQGERLLSAVNIALHPRPVTSRKGYWDYQKTDARSAKQRDLWHALLNVQNFPSTQTKHREPISPVVHGLELVCTY